MSVDANQAKYCIALAGGGVVAGAVGERVPGADRYGAVEPRVKEREVLNPRKDVDPAHDVVAHERGRRGRRRRRASC